MNLSGEALLKVRKRPDSSQAQGHNLMLDRNRSKKDIHEGTNKLTK